MAFMNESICFIKLLNDIGILKKKSVLYNKIENQMESKNIVSFLKVNVLITIVRPFLKKEKIYIKRLRTSR